MTTEQTTTLLLIVPAAVSLITSVAGYIKAKTALLESRATREKAENEAAALHAKASDNSNRLDHLENGWWNDQFAAKLQGLGFDARAFIDAAKSMGSTTINEWLSDPAPEETQEKNTP